jgi:hypothetical protein
MKLKVTDWKQAWFESHISERFFQEMSRLEKGAVQGLESTAQWMEQIMIEVGLLAQAMIRLEQDGAPEPQIRQAYDKAMRLSSLALHLITALDGADREQLRSASIVRGDRHDAPAYASAPVATPMSVAGTAKPAQAAAPAAAPRPAPAAAPPAAPAVPPTMPSTVRPTVPPTVRPAAAPAGPWRSPVPIRPSVAPGERPPSGPSAADVAAPPGAPSPLIATLLQVSGRNVPRSESALRQTIVSLSQQGLSRAEIEAVTGEPRHIIEAVLNHARSQPPGAAAQGR